MTKKTLTSSGDIIPSPGQREAHVVVNKEYHSEGRHREDGVRKGVAVCQVRDTPRHRGGRARRGSHSEGS